jgi:hypothetical protein
MSSISRINFFVVGAAKGGTTTVFERLNSRDDVYLSPLKEPNYYSTDIDIAKFSNEFKANTRLELGDYFSQNPLPVRQIGFVRDAHDYEQLFTPAPVSAKLIGECSTSYLWSESAAKNIFEAHPQAKILIMLRHPIQRLYSHYMMARKYGFTTLPLQEAVAKDMAHSSPGWGASELFVELGMYVDQISRYKDIFPEAQIKIILTPDLSNAEKWEDLLDWLDLPQLAKSTEEKKKSKDANTAGLPRFEKINRWLTSKGLKQKLGNFIPSKLKAPLVAWYYNAENLPKISAEEKKFLEGIYSEELLRLKSEHGISL